MVAVVAAPTYPEAVATVLASSIPLVVAVVALVSYSAWGYVTF